MWDELSFCCQSAATSPLALAASSAQELSAVSQLPSFAELDSAIGLLKAPLESLVIASFVQGLFVRDVEATLADALGDQAAISKSTVSQVCQAIKNEYDNWAGRRLDDVVLDYLFLDAAFFRMHPGSPAARLASSRWQGP